MRRLSAALGLLLVSFVAAGCAIPTQSAPSTMSPSKVPFHLLDPHLPTTTTTLPKPSSLVPVKVFFLNSDTQLTAATRVVAAPAPLTAVITSMLAGPTRTETTNQGQRMLSDVIPLGGGMPITVGEDTIGAIGLSGAPGGQDKEEACAKAGIEKVRDQLK